MAPGLGYFSYQYIPLTLILLDGAAAPRRQPVGVAARLFFSGLPLWTGAGGLFFGERFGLAFRLFVEGGHHQRRAGGHLLSADGQFYFLG